MKTISHIAVFLALLWLGSACQTLDPNADPVVVHSERAVQTAFLTVDKFLKFEREHELQMLTVAPKVHIAAEALRKQAPTAFRNAWGLIALYKANKTPENKANLYTALAVIDEVLRIAETNILLGKEASK